MENGEEFRQVRNFFTLSPPFVILRYNRSATATGVSVGMKCGCRQVVRHKLPKLVFAGSSPVTRSTKILIQAEAWIFRIR